MIRILCFVFLFAFLFAFLSLGYGQEEPKDVPPKEVAKEWMEAAGKRDMKAIRRLASKTVRKSTLNLMEQQSFLNYQGETKIIHQEIDGDRAVVVVRIENRGAVFTAEIRYDLMDLVREGGQWKVSDRGGGVLRPGKQPKQ